MTANASSTDQPSRTPSIVSASRSPSPTTVPRSRKLEFGDLAGSKDQQTERDEANAQTGESSADEITPIISYQRGSKRYDGAQTSTGADPSASRGSSTSSAKRRGSKRASQTTRDGVTRTEEQDEDGSKWREWLREIAEKYGAVELDNKGSTARDHLALGSFA